MSVSFLLSCQRLPPRWGWREGAPGLGRRPRLGGQHSPREAGTALHPKAAAPQASLQERPEERMGAGSLQRPYSHSPEHPQGPPEPPQAHSSQVCGFAESQQARSRHPESQSKSQPAKVSRSPAGAPWGAGEGGGLGQQEKDQLAAAGERPTLVPC